VKIGAYKFPAEQNALTKAYFTQAAPFEADPKMAAAMRAFAANINDAEAVAVLRANPAMVGKVGTTCVPTMADAGHALNALPQRATAYINCRIFPGHSVEEVQQELQSVIGDSGVSVTLAPPLRPLAKTPPLDPAIIAPMEKLAARYFPGVPVVPTMSTGATDGIFLAAVGIPTYGVPGAWLNPDMNGIHGLNERIEIKSLMTGRAYLYELVKAYTK